MTSLLKASAQGFLEGPVFLVAALAVGAAGWLRPGGWLVVEIGSGQGDEVRALLGGAGLVDVASAPDLAGHDRIARARRPEK